MAGKLRVHDWHEFQHYKERNPSWIKLHKKILDNYKFHRLPIASRALAPMIWLLASESKDGSLDYDMDKIAFRLHASALELEAAIVPLISGGFLELSQDAGQPLADRAQDACLEKETEKETEVEKEKERARAPSAALVVKRETSNKRKGTRLAIDAEPDEQDCRYAGVEYGWSAERIALEWSNLRDWSQSSRNGVKLDWHAAWRTWVRRRHAEQPTARPVADRRAGIVAALSGELAGEADGLDGFGRNAQPDGDGTGEPVSIGANVGIDGDPGISKSLRGGDGEIVRMGGIDGAGAGREGIGGTLPRSIGGHSSGPADDSYWPDGSDAPISQHAQASGHSEAHSRGLIAASGDALDGAGIVEGNPFDIPPFLRRSA